MNRSAGDRSVRAPDREIAVLPAADPLSDVLGTVRLTGALFFQARAAAPWIAEVPGSERLASILLRRAQRVVSYHLVVTGACWASEAGRPPVRLETDDLLLVPGGEGYFLSSDPELRPTQSLEATLDGFRDLAERQPSTVALGRGDAVDCQLVCGYLGYDPRPFQPILGAIPHLARIRLRPDAERIRLRMLADFALAESREDRSGTRCVLLRLSELMFVEVLRGYLAELPADQPGWLAGLRDPMTGRALALLHGAPERAWTLTSLAGQAGTSRSTLADRFTHFVGQPPMQYLSRWRMQLAAKLLSEGDRKVRSIGAEVGYTSEEAFSRAFKRFFGDSPSAWRRRSR